MFKRCVGIPIYSRNVIDFLTVAAEYCSFLESCDKESDKNFIDKITKILPLLYLKVSLLPKLDRQSTRLNYRHIQKSRMPTSALKKIDNL